MSSPFMTAFRTPLIVQKTGERQWKLFREFTYEVGHLGSGDIITVPKNFTSDFASIPRAFWSIMPPDGQYTAAAIIHDWLCVVRTRSSDEAAKIFLEAMEILGVGYTRRYTMYWAVRMGGPHFKAGDPPRFQY